MLARHAEHRRSLAPGLVGLLAVLLLVAPIAAPAGASIVGPAPQRSPSIGIGIRLLDVPAATAGDPRARLYIVDHLAPGTVIERRVEVSNATDSPQTVTLYAAAASIDDGGFAADAGRTENELSSWTTATPGRSEIAAGENLIASLVIDVPADASPGERYGVIWAEVRSDDSDHGDGVVQVSRVGVRLYVSVGLGSAPAADFTIESLTAERSSDGNPAVSAVVRNTGGRALDISGSLQLADGPGALSAGPFPAALGRTLAIGETQGIAIVLDKTIPAGPWNAQLTVRSGLIEHIAEATITFPRSGSAVPIAITEPSDRPRPVVPATLALVFLLIAIVAAVRWRPAGPQHHTGVERPKATSDAR